MTKPAPSRFEERASELRSMRSWVEYQPCLRDGVAAEEVKSYLATKIKELDCMPAPEPTPSMPMIPTREQIDAWAQQPCGQVAAWCTDMRTEIDRLNRETSTLKEFNEAALAEQAKLQKDVDAAKSELVRVRRNAEALLLRFDSGGVVHMVECENCAKLRAELKAAEDDAMEESDRADRNAELVAKLRAELDSAKAQRDMLHRRLYPTPCKGCPGCSSYADCPDEIHRLTTALDAAHTEAALARDALNKATAATDPDAKLRELRAWMVDKARMRLREGHGWSFEEGHINLASVVERIDELLAAPAKPAEPAPVDLSSLPRRKPNFAFEDEPAPETVQHHGLMMTLHNQGNEPVTYEGLTVQPGERRTVFRSVDPDEVKSMMGETPTRERLDAMRRWLMRESTLSPEPWAAGFQLVAKLLGMNGWRYVEKPKAIYLKTSGEPPAPTDDTRELVAQLADVVQHLCITNKQGSHVTAIAAQLRGGK